MLMTDAFGDGASQDAVVMFKKFALVLGLLVIGIVILIYGTLSLNELDTLKRLSFLFFALAGFFALPDLINVLQVNQLLH